MTTYIKDQIMMTTCFFASISAFLWHFESAQHNPWAQSRPPLPSAAYWDPSVSLWAELPGTRLALCPLWCTSASHLSHWCMTIKYLKHEYLFALQLLLSWTLGGHFPCFDFTPTQLPSEAAFSSNTHSKVWIYLCTVYVLITYHLN